MGSSLPQASAKGARAASPNNRLGTRAVAVVALIAPLALFGAYRLGAHSSQQTGAVPAKTTSVRAASATDGAAPVVERAAEPSFPRRIIEPAPLEGEPSELSQAAQEPNALEHRDQSIAEIRASGPDKNNLFDSAQRVTDGWARKLAQVGVGADVGRFECHGKGCFLTIVHDSEADVGRGMEVITRTGEFHGWHSGKMRSGPIARPDGKVEVTWFLFPPQAGQEALAATLPADNIEELRAAAP
jgi:hypothetical protein